MSDAIPNQHGPWPFPAISNVEMAPLHESITPTVKLQTTQPKTVPRTWTTTDPAAGERRCCRCGAWKPLTDFHRDRAASFGRMHSCKSCWSERDQRRRQRAA